MHLNSRLLRPMNGIYIHKFDLQVFDQQQDLLKAHKFANRFHPPSMCLFKMSRHKDRGFLFSGRVCNSNILTCFNIFNEHAYIHTSTQHSIMVTIRCTTNMQDQMRNICDANSVS
jgi:hypothetical protein